MTYDFDMDMDMEEAWDNTPTDGAWMEAGEHTCTITSAEINDGALIIWLRTATGERGKIRQALAPDKIVFLKKLVAVLAPPVRTLREFYDAIPTFRGLIVEVKSIQKGQYVNHYVNRCIGRSEESTDEVPF